MLSVGGTWVTNMINTSVNHTQIAELIKSDVENKAVNEVVYALNAEVQNLRRDQIETRSGIRTMQLKITEVEVDAARSAEAMENLVKATNQLNHTVGELVVAVAKLEQ